MKPNTITWPKPDIIIAGSEILKTLPNEPTDERERMVIDYAQSGNVPSWMRSWVPVEIVKGDTSVTFYCLPDYFTLGTDDDFVRIRVNPVTAEYIATTIGGVLPTRKMMLDIYHASKNKVPAMPMSPEQGYPYDASMMVTSRWPIMDKRIADYMAQHGLVNGDLTGGHLKDIVIGKGLGDTKGEYVGICGWFDANGNIIQGPSINWHSHEWTYKDYSHGSRFVWHYVCVKQVGGATDTWIPIWGALANVDLASFLSDEGPLSYPSQTSYLSYHPDYLMAA